MEKTRLYRRSDPSRRPDSEEIEIDIFSKDFPAYEAMYYKEEFIKLPTGEYSIDSFYIRNVNSIRSTIYLKKINGFIYKAD